MEHRAEEIREVFAHYRTYHPRAHPKPSSKQPEWGKIRARLNEGYSVADLRTAIDGCHRSPFHQGENDRQRRYDSLELIVRTGDHVAKFLELAERPPGPVLTEREQRGHRAATQWLARGQGAAVVNGGVIHDGQ